MDIGIVIVSWNVRELLLACLDSVYLDLAQSAHTLRGVVCVIDNGSHDGTVASVRAQFPHTQVIEAENKGMGAGNNLGLKALLEHAAPEALLVLNPDTVIRAGALQHLAQGLRAYPRAGVVAPKLLNADGSLQHAGFRFPGLVQLGLDLFPLPARLSRLNDSLLNGRYPAAWYAGGAPFQVEHTLGAAFLVRRATLEDCGLFDEAFPMYCEEIDWQWRMAQRGWERWLAPAAEVVHYGGQSTRQMPVRSLQQLWTSRARLYRRYHAPLTLALARALVTLGMRQRIRQNFQRAARSEITPEQRAEINLALTEVLHAWRDRHPPRSTN